MIAILAAISIVAFNGIQDRAKLVKNTAAMDKVGKAIQLWTAENGKSLRDSGAGAGYGAFSQIYSGNPSVETLLRDSGYLIGNFNELSAILVAPCKTDASDTRWAVIAIVTPDPDPDKTTADARADLGCDSSISNTYTTGTYTGRNFFKVY